MLEAKSQALLSLQDKAGLYLVIMDKENRLKTARKAAKLTQAQVAEALEITPQAVSGWERGGRPDQDKVADLARLYKKSVEWILEGKEIDQAVSPDEDVRSEDVAGELDDHSPKVLNVKVKGYVGASSEAIYYRLSDEDFEEVEAPEGSSDQTVAVEIKGKSFGPLMNTWLVFYDDVRSPVTPDLLNQVCVVGLADDRILIKEIRQNGKGGYRLMSNSSTDEPIEDAQIEWAAKVKAMRPR